MKAGYYFPMTEEQERKIMLRHIRIAITFFAIGFLLGIGFGYAWRMVQMVE